MYVIETLAQFGGLFLRDCVKTPLLQYLFTWRHWHSADMVML